MPSVLKRPAPWAALGLLALAAAAGGLYARALPRAFAVRIRVDFGPAMRAAAEQRLFVERGTTPKEALSQVFPVLSGKACCSLREVVAVDGVKIDPARNRWWVCALNGSRNVSPVKRKLKPGDRLEWLYLQDAQ